jgi:spore coat protein H
MEGSVQGRLGHVAVLVVAVVGLVAVKSTPAADNVRGRDATPDYPRVFSQDSVGRLDLRISASDWDAVMRDMTEIAGVFGGGGPQGGGPGGGNPGGVNPGGGNQPDADPGELFSRNPIYVPVHVSFDGETFQNSGFRLKGNAGLMGTWHQGKEKLPFRLNFDALEDRFPQTRDQTFFGFPNLTFQNGAQDNSYLRYKIIMDLFREAGLPAPETSFMQVFLDRGAGPVYQGLYTMVEVPDRPMLEKFFGSDSGNLYKPSGAGARWTIFDKDDFSKRTNEEDEDWTDIAGAIAALHETRSDAARWRFGVEARFEVDVFLRWLALNTIIGNSDAYGGLAHNYYLYGSPRHRDRLFWIPWDPELGLRNSGNAPGGGPGGGGPGGAVPGGGNTGGGSDTTIDLFHDGIRADWPLIRFFMDDGVYRAAYRKHVEDLLATVFEPSRVSATIRAEHARIAPYVIGAEGEDPRLGFVASPRQFDDTVYGASGLVAAVQSRAAAVRRALESAR